MKTKYLILTLSLVLAAGTAVAAIKHGQVSPWTSVRAAQTTTAAVPRVVITASRAHALFAPTQATELRADAEPVARVVVSAPRPKIG